MSTFVAATGTRLFYGNDVAAGSGSEAARMAAIAAAASNEVARGDVIKWSQLPSGPRAQINVTRQNAVDDDGNDFYHEEYAAGFAKPSMLEFDMALHDTEVQTLESLKDGGANHSFSLHYKNGAQRAFVGYVADLKPALEEGGQVVYTVSIQATGRMYYSPASAVSILQSVSMLGAKTVTLNYGGTVLYSDFVAGNIALSHNGVLVLGGTVTAGATNKQVNIAASGFQTDPTGDTFVVFGPSYTRPRPAQGVVGSNL